MAYYNRDGTKIGESLNEMTQGDREKIIEINNRKVKETTLKDGKWVSTVFLGIDHGFGEGKPLIFETMVFPKKGDYGDLYYERYSTEEEAIKGHDKIVKKFNKKRLK